LKFRDLTDVTDHSIQVREYFHGRNTKDAMPIPLQIVIPVRVEVWLITAIVRLSIDFQHQP